MTARSAPGGAGVPGESGGALLPAKPGAALVVRDDVHLRRAGSWLYVCASDGPPLRLRLSESDPDRPDGELTPDQLPTEAVAALRRRGLLVPADQPLRRHPSYPGTPAAGAGVWVLGGDLLSTRVAACVRDAGVPVTHMPGPGMPVTHMPGPGMPVTRMPGPGAPVTHMPAPVAPVACVPDAGVLVVALTAPDELLTAVGGQAIAEGSPVLVHAAAGGRIYWAALRPPTTACPLCVSVRIRACRPDRALGSLDLAATLGAGRADHWPSAAAAAATISHQAVRLLTEPDARAERGATPADQTCDLIELDLDSASTTRHPLLHTPGCPACGPAAAVPVLDPPATTAHSWARMRRAVDPLTGIVSGIVVVPPGDPHTGVDCTVAWARGGTDTTWFSSVRASTVGGATKDDPTLARVCALGEILERYAAGIHRPESFVRASLAELGPAAVDPRTLPLGSPGEYTRMAGELVPYRPDLVIDWVQGRSLVTGRPRYLPAAAVYVPYRAPSRHERLLHPNSTGLAAGANPAHAIHGGLLEVIERDAAAIHWYNRLPAPTLDWSGLPAGPARTVLSRIAARGVTLLAKDISTDLGVPAVLLLGRFEVDGQPVALCGFRADLDPHRCLLGAGQELEHLLAMFSRSRELGNPTVPDPAAEPRDIWDFATYYCHTARIGALDHLLDGPLVPVTGPAGLDPAGLDPAGPEPAGPDPATDHAAEVEIIVARLVAAGHEPVTVDITPIDVAECGVSVARTVVPGLQPVSFHRVFRHLGGRRVYAAPVRMGLRSRELTEDELNPDPIPLG